MALPGLRGTDHVGFTVPDLDVAHDFFTRILGCEFVYSLGPFARDVDNIEGCWTLFGDRSRYVTLETGLRAALPDAALHLQGVMPRARKYADRIRTLNAAYRDLARKHAATFIDLFPVFDDGSGEMDARCTLDRLHLNGVGYVRWRETLATYV